MNTNIAYTEWYQMRRRRFESVFSQEHLLDGEPETIQSISDDYSLRSRFYSGEIDGLNLDRACETELIDKDGAVLYSWRCLDCSGAEGGAFLGLWWTAGGNHYLMFRRELYGYSVLETETGRDFHYVPSCAYPGDDGKFDETFILCSAIYDAKTGLLAADGCYWGCPYSTIVLDFSDPFAEHPADLWLDIAGLLPRGTYNGSHITTDSWSGGDLILECLKDGMSFPELLRIPESELRAALNRVKST